MTPRRLRLVVLVAGLVSSAIVLVAWTQPWAELQLRDGRELTTLGQDAAPALSGIALAAVALTAALMIARPRLRLLLGVVQFALGGLAIAVAAPLVFSVDALQRASWPIVTDATGVAGGAVHALIQLFGQTLWPAVAFGGSVLIAVAGLAVVLTSRRWPTATSKYETAGASTDSTAGAWDALSEGDDPTTR
jgi:hypothetical protein